MRLIFLIAVSFTLSACAELPAVVNDLANIANLILADVAKGMTGDAVITDVLSQTSSTDLNLVISIVESLLEDPKTPAADMPSLENVDRAAKLRSEPRQAR